MDEDRSKVETVWDTLVDSKTAVTHEFRFKTPWQDPNGNMTDTWVLMSAYPEKDENGGLKSVFGSITNISAQKSAEDFQKRRMEEAMELKRQQENFIDMTSHEMRNPLSAILQCSDEISTSLAAYKAVRPESRSEEQLLEILDDSIDASQTIALCAQHQKRIVDDILTLSKLDSALLVVTPVDVYPVEVVQRALKMFEGELETNDISMRFQIEQSYLDLQVGRVKLDPSRLLQVLINLTTNAIKFSAGAEKRTIVVSIGATSERPSGTESGVTYFPSRSKTKDVTTDDAEWGRGDNIFLLFAVEDTGRGLDEKEKVLLFQRFRQASPRTHVQYGGSGLGLFISRELTELQGGEIGVASERGVGSTFAFYVRARKVPNDQADAFWNGNEKEGADLAVILMDLEMPIMDGLTATMKIRELETEGTIVKHVPIIAVTANARLEQIETAMSAGMDDVVSKPFRIPELVPKIEELVAKSKSATSPASLPLRK
ncbi:putative Autoinducer 2 sensor kinase/phosphatase luxQ [Glarea lozoyensis 74030]|uniref:Putative Autoinducer 2 sensor kinase/phosphatase luxQ n=1 Tax=Glarea lozoyensis (strain ATCC 74030 / MF5533) TaxID=1104152 RepID=H0ECL9_GLAL7|nr:putative Autoinducer 2 sensor kinase/phosphatase luxQ [Glarea lozoyensis 74030]